ncbi:MAG: hypothetical protein Q8O41_09420 [Candidatus Methanoperedens sp.]|nr:hypothetical protein [Candidatus Methanoperedens sp.]
MRCYIVKVWDTLALDEEWKDKILSDYADEYIERIKEKKPEWGMRHKEAPTPSGEIPQKVLRRKNRLEIITALSLLILPIAAGRRAATVLNHHPARDGAPSMPG